MKSGKINDNKLLKLVDQGLTQPQIAKQFGVSKQAISKRLKELRGRTTRVIATKKIAEIVDRKINTLDQLSKINDEANRLLDELAGEPGLQIKVMSEIRGQLKLQMEIFQLLYSLEAAADFQNAVLTTLGEIEPDVRNRVIQKLNQERSVRSAIKLY